MIEQVKDDKEYERIDGTETHEISFSIPEHNNFPISKKMQSDALAPTLEQNTDNQNPPTDDITVWNSFLAGNDEAYELIYKQHVRKLFLYGTTLTTDEELVKDCIHDVFIHIYKNRRNLGETNNIRLYLISALKNAMRMVFRKQKTYDKYTDSLKEDLTDLTDNTIETIINIEDEIERKSQIETVWNILTGRQKEIIYYRFIEGMSLSEISKRENINYQSVANIVQRALKKMQKFYSKK